MATQQSLILIKPDGVQRSLVGEIISRLERKGLVLVGMKLVQADDALAREHYAVHAERPFFPALLKFITSGPLVAIAVRGDEAISVVRNIVGTTDGRSAAPGTIRGDFGISMGANLIHASDAPETAETELSLWFPDGTIDWTRCNENWLDAD